MPRCFIKNLSAFKVGKLVNCHAENKKIFKLNGQQLAIFCIARTCEKLPRNFQFLMNFFKRLRFTGAPLAHKSVENNSADFRVLRRTFFLQNGFLLQELAKIGRSSCFVCREHLQVQKNGDKKPKIPHKLRDLLILE